MAQVKLSYKDAGVDIDAGDAFVERIKAKVRTTYNDRVVSGVGGFAALYKAQSGKLLAVGTDGVGTKVKIAQALGQHDTIGVDLVAMCVNDIICTGATPQFFLDYLAVGKLDIGVAESIVSGIIDGCKQSEMSLIGGETAEMPDVYRDGEYDLAGFSVGEVDEDKVLDGRNIKEGDTLLVLPSSGLHSNGYSLARKLIKLNEPDLMKRALVPTRIYWRAVKNILPYVKGLAHITGGGLQNIPRMSGDFDYVINTLPPRPDIFDILAERSGLDDRTLFETFNMGLGMVIATDNPDAVVAYAGEMVYKIGHIEKGNAIVKVRTDVINFEVQG